MFAVGSPSGSIDKPFRALLFDSWYDQYVGVVCMLGVVDGKIRKGDKITSAHSNAKYEVSEVSIILNRHHIQLREINACYRLALCIQNKFQPVICMACVTIQFIKTFTNYYHG